MLFGFFKGSNFPQVSSFHHFSGNFQKQRHDELSHWNEWKHWVHGRAVESHDFEDNVGYDRMMMTDRSDRMISD